MARLRRQWGVQFRDVSGEWETQAAAPAMGAAEAQEAVDALYPHDLARVVTRVVTDWEVVPRGQASA